MYKELFAAAAIVLTFAMYVPYVRSIHAEQIRPHAFSWITWTLGAFVVFLAQIAGHGGAGAWPIGVSALLTAYIAALAYRKRADVSITRSDWAFLAIAVAAVSCWVLTSDPLLAVVLLAAAELAGFGPTYCAALGKPHEEHIGFYFLGAVRNAFALVALNHYSLVTVLFPAAKGVVCALLVALIGYRRRQVRLQGVPSGSA